MGLYDRIRKYIHWETVVSDKWETKCLNIFDVVKIPFRRTVNLAPILNDIFDIRKCPPASGKLRKLQLANVKLLEIFDLICRKNNIPYYLCGGTALGAVRHGGFIPWDDDLDVSVPGECRDLIEDVLERAFDGTCLYLWGVEKTRLGDATLRISHRDFQSLNLDVFYPYCFSTSEADRDRVCEAWAKAYFKYTCDYRQVHKNETKETIRKFRETEDAYYASLVPEHVGFFDSRATYMTTELHCSSFRYIPMKCILPLKEVTFEGKKVFAPADLDGYAKCVYGEYNSFPPHFDHHKDVFFCFDEAALQNVMDELDLLIKRFSTET